MVAPSGRRRHHLLVEKLVEQPRGDATVEHLPGHTGDLRQIGLNLPDLDITPPDRGDNGLLDPTSDGGQDERGRRNREGPHAVHDGRA